MMAWTLMTVHIFPLFYHCSTHTKKPRLSLLVYYHLALYFILPPLDRLESSKSASSKKDREKILSQGRWSRSKTICCRQLHKWWCNRQPNLLLLLGTILWIDPLSSSKNLRLFSSLYFFRSEILGKINWRHFQKQIWGRAVMTCTSSFNEEL